MAEQNEIEKIVTPMMEHLCDHLCRFPWETERKEDLEDICAECKMGQYACDILNTYNQEKREWIPVSEGLPEPGIYNASETHVILSAGDRTLEGYLSKSGNWMRANGANLRDLSPVTHWMPMPNPCQSANEGEDE